MRLELELELDHKPLPRTMKLQPIGEHSKSRGIEISRPPAVSASSEEYYFAEGNNAGRPSRTTASSASSRSREEKKPNSASEQLGT